MQKGFHPKMDKSEKTMEPTQPNFVLY